MTKVVVIGGKGFVGSAYVRLFEARGIDCRVIGREEYSLVAGTSCDVLINANGNSSKLLARRDPMADFEANVTATRRFLADIDCGFYIHLSSCDVYPDCSSPSQTCEDAILAPAGQSPYGFHKWLAEQCVRHCAERWLIIRPGGFVGPGMKKNAIFDILNGGPLWLDPQSELQFIHTDDAARVVWGLYEQGVANEVVNVCGDGVVRLSDVMAWVGKDVPVQPNSPIVRYEVSVEKLRGLACVPDTIASVSSFVSGGTGRGS